MLGLAPNNTGESTSPIQRLEKTIERSPDSTPDSLDLPQSVLQIVATSLQCDLLVAGVLTNSARLAETVLCVPKGRITAPVRLSKGIIAAAASCKVCFSSPPPS